MASVDLHKKHLTVTMDDISTAGSVYVVSPFRGWIERIDSVISGAITGADAAITVELNGTAQSHLAFTIANSGSGAGVVDTVSTTKDAGAVTPGTVIEMITDGASTNTVSATYTITVRV